MKKAFALVGALALAGAANAALVVDGGGYAGYMVEVDNGVAGEITVQVWLDFTASTDGIISVYGDVDRSLTLHLPGGMVNYNPGMEGTHFADINWGSHGIYDSYLSMSDGSLGYVGHPNFSPNFWGVAGGENMQVLTNGLTDITDNDTAYFFYGATNVFGINPTGQILIGQFTFEAASSAGFTYDGGVQWDDGSDAVIYTPFHVPAPGALALLGLAGLAGRCRRR